MPALSPPALVAARHWAKWSVEHNQLASQFQQNATQAECFGAIVFGMLLLNIPVAVWKPRRQSKHLKSDTFEVSVESMGFLPTRQRPGDPQIHPNFADGERPTDNGGRDVPLFF